MASILIYHFASPETFVEVSWYLLLAALTSLFAGLGFSNFLLKFIFNPNTHLKTSLLNGIKKLVLMWFFMFLVLNILLAYNKGFLPIDEAWIVNLVLLEGIIGAVTVEVLYSSLMAKSKVPELIKLNIWLIVVNGPFRILMFLFFDQSVLMWAIVGVVSKLLVVAHFARSLWKGIDFAEKSSNHKITYKMISGYLLFPIFSIGQWLTASIDKYIGLDSLTVYELANYQFTFQFAALIGMVISQIDLYLLPNLFDNYAKGNLKNFARIQIRATTLSGIAMSAISTISWYFLAKDNSGEALIILLLMSMAQLFYIPVAIYSSLMTKVRNETNKLFFAPYLSIGIVMPLFSLYVDMSQAFNLAGQYFLICLSTMIIVILSDAFFGEKVLFQALVGGRFLSFPVLIMVYCGIILFSNKNSLVLILVVFLGLTFSLGGLRQIFRRIDNYG